MRELSEKEIQQVSGGDVLPSPVTHYAPRAGKLGMVYVAAYETATWFGADRLGQAIGNTVYDLVHS
ncbi:MAG: hypothetical protein ACQETO_04920 [Pseudomonadota bacterium]